MLFFLHLLVVASDAGNECHFALEHAARALRASRRGHHQEAIDWAKKALRCESSPALADACYVIANYRLSLHGSGDVLARHWLERALRQNPQ